VLPISINLWSYNLFQVVFRILKNRRPYLETRVSIQIVFHLSDGYWNIKDFQVVGFWGHIYQIISKIGWNLNQVIV